MVDTLVQRRRDRITVTVGAVISTEAAREVASREVGLRPDAIRFIARQRLPDGSIVYTFQLRNAMLPNTSP